MQIKEVMRKGMIKLKTNGIQEPNLKSRLLMQYILNRPREYLLVHDDKQLTLRQEVNYFKAIKKIVRWSTFATYNTQTRIYEINVLCG